ncbi:MAG: hypothetical protein ACRD6X_17910, partial [Pyrinomonadaceae bacterium]
RGEPRRTASGQAQRHYKNGPAFRCLTLMPKVPRSKRRFVPFRSIWYQTIGFPVYSFELST